MERCLKSSNKSLVVEPVVLMSSLAYPNCYHVIPGLRVRQANGGAQAQVQRRRAREEADDDVRPHLLQSIRGTAHEQL